MPLNIQNTESLFQQGVAFHRAGCLQEAHDCYVRVLQIDPRHAAALYNVGALAIDSGHADQAIALLNQSLALDPNSAHTCNALGEAYRAMLDGDRALEWYAKAIAIDPQNVSAYNNRGIVEAILGRIEAAIAAWETAIAILDGQPGTEISQSRTYNNLGNAYLEQRDVAQAIASHRARELSPKDAILHSNLLRDHSHANVLTPSEMLALHRDYWLKHAAGVQPLVCRNAPHPDRPLRIGLVSPDFREHSVTYFLTGLFDHYDRQQFALFGYANVTSPDEFTQRIAQRCAGWRNICGTPDDQAAAMIHADQIDILIDLAGHTAGNRLRLFAYQPAPVQVAYLGYALTTGTEAIAWRITDAQADPEGLTESHFTERLYRLPRCAWCYRPPVDVPAVETAPSMRGESPPPFTFGSFNNYAKVTEQMIGLWSQILLAIPQSRLLLKAMALRDDSVCRQIHSRFAVRGIGADRLLFSGKQPNTAEHLARYLSVDVALDTFPYHGTTTTCEALWMNVPVITMEGSTHVSRVGVSLLDAVGLGGLIARDGSHYVDLAADLARHPQRLADCRKDLRNRMRASPLMDEAGFAREFGVALRDLAAVVRHSSLTITRQPNRSTRPRATVRHRSTPPPAPA